MHQVIYVAGLGCRHGCSREELLHLLERALALQGLQPDDLIGLASSEHKRDEPGLRQLAEQLNLPLTWLSASQLAPYQSRLSQPSALSLQVTGSAGVAEACALAQAENLSGARAGLLCEKIRSASATCALACAPIVETV
jgi:cobalt-precorrin 5A hydrolase